jgi:hypothetical protein
MFIFVWRSIQIVLFDQPLVETKINQEPMTIFAEDKIKQQGQRYAN